MTVPTWVTEILSGLAIAVVTAWVTVRLSLKRFRSERLWERKYDAYAEILNALSQQLRLATYLAKDLTGTAGQSKRGQRLREGHEQAAARLSNAAAVGGFILPGRVAERIDRLFDDRMNLVSDHPNPDLVFYEEVAILTRDAINDVREIARRDLSID